MLVYSDAVLIFSSAFQVFKPISRWNQQIGNLLNPVYLVQLALSYGPNRLRAAFSSGPGWYSVKNILSSGVFERFYHTACYNDQRYNGQWV